ncbi:predicted protein [Botrytis cinerea T4]|uniref:Uncharacterized protein n=1 Tax=Botryotinia fuckeliana (strain T4) TaxID=999810 RepID=G2XUG0_BOTF4|nr:predicted protein [Botrytis cinerea T4]
MPTIIRQRSIDLLLFDSMSFSWFPHSSSESRVGLSKAELTPSMLRVAMAMISSPCIQVVIWIENCLGQDEDGSNGYRMTLL